MKSEILSNAKNRTKLYDLNQLIRKVFNGYRYIKLNSNIILPLTMDSVRSRPIYDNAFFIYKEDIFDFLDNTAINGDILNRALKDKADDIIIANNNIILEKKERYNIGSKLNEFQMNDSLKHKGLVLYNSLEDSDFISNYILSDIDIESILNYNVLLNIIGYDDKIPIELVMTKEIFPFIKKATSTTISIYHYNNKTKEHIYKLLINSKYESLWEFINIIHIYALY